MGLTMTGPALGPIFARVAAETVAGMRKALTAAAADTSAAIEDAGRHDLHTAGNFGGWAGGFKAMPTVDDVGVTIKVTIEAPFWWIVHQQGRVIHGKPWLAIPLSFAGVPKGMYARDFPGGLFSIFNRKSGGAPLLLSLLDRKPKYFLRESVTIPKRLSLVEVSTAAAAKFGEHVKAQLGQD